MKIKNLKKVEKVLSELQSIFSKSPELQKLCILGVTIGLSFVLTKLSKKYKIDLEQLLKEVNEIDLDI